MGAKYSIFHAPAHGLTDYDKKRFILYSRDSHTEYRIDIDEVIRLIDDVDVKVSSKVRAYIDSILEPSHKGS